MNLSPTLISAVLAGMGLAVAAFPLCRAAGLRRRREKAKRVRLIRQGLSNAETYRNTCLYGRLT